ncbi:MAG: HAD-IA family hydrolase [Anaerolineales bacterium]|nr:HAD-IA family hydrolase [Anaerolineales bacterium]
MALTLLLDLDDTLLGNKMNTFVPAYLKHLSEFLAPYAEPERLIQQLLTATRKMVENRNSGCTLKEVFDAAFYPALKLRVEDVREIIDRFYAEVFPELRAVTHPIPGAQEVVETALSRGYRVAIATNPLFPRAALLHRLAWAGLPVECYPSLFVPSYETFHFAKPNPAYYGELLAQMGWPEGPVLMVGDDPINDLQAGKQAGLAVYWCRPEGAGVDAAQANGMGSLEDLLAWLDTTNSRDLLPDLAAPSAVLSVLHATPAALNSLCRGLSLEQWTRRPQENEWSLTEIACHLRDVDEEVNLPRIQKVLYEENPFLPGKDTDPWATERDYLHQDGVYALQAFTRVRLKLVNLLDQIQPEDWGRPARHAIFGPSTLNEIAIIHAGHDRMHVRQATRCLIAITPQTMSQAPGASSP